jgi:uncharacterized integral membrane protein
LTARVDRRRAARRHVAADSPPDQATPEKEFPTMPSSPYKRRKPSIVRNFWIYRRLIALAFVLGLMLWFIWANDATVTVAFPFGLGSLTSTTGLVILLSAMVGSVMTALAMTLMYTIRRAQGQAQGTGPTPPLKAGDAAAEPLPDDRPPPDYARTTEGFPDSRWS